MSVEIRSEDKGVRIRVDRAGIAAVSALLSREEAVDALSTLAGILGYQVVTADPDHPQGAVS